MREIGPYVFFTHEEGDFEKGIEAVIKKIFNHKKLPINEYVELKIEKIAREKADAVRRKVKRGGLPSNIRILFSLTCKKAVSSWADKIVLTNEELSNLILNYARMGFSYRRMHKTFIPQDIIPTDEERQAFACNGVGKIWDKKAKKMVTKISEIFKKRKCRSAHLFEKGDKWHLLYFDYNDMYTPKGSNHYVLGPHIHYISYLCGKNLDKEKIWESMNLRQVSMKSIHIRYFKKKTIEGNGVSL